MNKKGEERYLSPILWIVWGIVAAAFIVAVIIFYSGEADVRELEAVILANRVADCISDTGVLKEEVLDEAVDFDGEIQIGYDLIDSCGLNREIFEEIGDYYVRVSIFDESIQELRNPIEVGNSGLEFSCIFQRKDDPFSVCVKRVVFLQRNSEQSQRVVLEIIASSRNKGSEL